MNGRPKIMKGRQPAGGEGAVSTKRWTSRAGRATHRRAVAIVIYRARSRRCGAVVTSQDRAGCGITMDRSEAALSSMMRWKQAYGRSGARESRRRIRGSDGLKRKLSG